MTTIAYRNGVLASDSRSSVKDMVDDDTCKKIWRLKNGSLIGLSGDYNNGLVLLHTLKALIKGNKNNTINTLPSRVFKGVNALLVQSDGEYFFYSPGCWEKMKLPYYAIGTGRYYALPVMDFGGTAIDGVKAGIKRDIYSGGRVQKLEI